MTLTRSWTVTFYATRSSSFLLLLLLSWRFYTTEELDNDETLRVTGQTRLDNNDDLFFFFAQWRGRRRRLVPDANTQHDSILLWDQNKTKKKVVILHTHTHTPKKTCQWTRYINNINKNVSYTREKEEDEHSNGCFFFPKQDEDDENLTGPFFLLGWGGEVQIVRFWGRTTFISCNMEELRHHIHPSIPFKKDEPLLLFWKKPTSASYRIPSWILVKTGDDIELVERTVLSVLDDHHQHWRFSVMNFFFFFLFV